MEEEKLQEAQRAFQEDVSRFTKYLEEMGGKAAEAVKKAEELTVKKEKKAAKIELLEKELMSMD